MIDLHENARIRFEELAAELIRSLTTFVEPARLPETRFTPDIFKAHTITEKEVIGDVHVGWLNPDGELFGLAVAERGGTRTGLVGEGFVKLRALVAAMARVQPFLLTASPEFLQQEIFNWLKARYRNESEARCVDFVLQKLSAALATYRILVPVSELYVESPLVIGTVTIRPFPNAILEQIEALPVPQDSSTPGTQRPRSTGRMRSQFQGLAAAEVSVCAEPTKAEQLAAERIDLVVSVLRFFAPAHLDQRSVSRIALWGYAPERSGTVFVLDSDGRCSSVVSSLIDTPGKAVLSDDLVRFFRGIGLSEVLAILDREEWNDMETALLQGMSTFGRAALTPDLRERLVWYCAGLESLLLKDRSEAITQNLAERLGIFTYDSVGERESALVAVREAYSLRSEFVHHATTIPAEGREVVTRFAHHGLKLFLRVATRCHEFSTRQQFVQYIDRLKLSGGSVRSGGL